MTAIAVSIAVIPRSGPNSSDRLVRSLEYLQFKARSHSAVFACDTVSRVVSEQHKYRLYMEMFPKEWKRSKASLYKSGHFKAYSERTNEFFHLVNEKCFPLLEYWHDDPDLELERFAIPPMNFDLCCEEVDFAGLRDSYLAGLMFYFVEDDEIWTFFSEKYGVDRETLPPIKASPHANVWNKKQNRRTRPYSDLIRLVDHSTENPWLDITNCQYPEYFEWDKETIDLLTKSYRSANQSFRNLDELDQRIEKDAQKFLHELISFWNTGQIEQRRS